MDLAKHDYSYANRLAVLPRRNAGVACSLIRACIIFSIVAELHSRAAMVRAAYLRIEAGAMAICILLGLEQDDHLDSEAQPVAQFALPQPPRGYASSSSAPR